MNMTTRNVLISVVAVIAIIVLGYFAWQERETPAVPTPAESTTTAATSTDQTINVSATSTTVVGGYTITPITSGGVPTAPNYKIPLTFSSNINATTQAQDQSQFVAVQAALASNSKDYSAWLELGILRENTGDYTGAAADWKYVTKLYPSDPTAYANLGNLYANDLKEPAQGIAYYKLAIKADPTKEETFYDNLAQIYLAEGDKADAKATLQRGINVQVVGYQNLQTELNSM